MAPGLSSPVQQDMDASHDARGGCCRHVPPCDGYLRRQHGDDKSAMAVSANAVRTVPSGTNSVPTFPAGATDEEDVDENSPPGTNVGDPVKASDSPGEILTYHAERD